MPIEFSCPECEKRLRTGDDRAGARAICPECQQTITVPAADLAQTAAWSSAALGASVEASSNSRSESQPHPSQETSEPSRSRYGYCAICGTARESSAGPCVQCGHVSGAGTQPVDLSIQTQFAGFWRRAAAMFLDLIIVGICQTILLSSHHAEELGTIITLAYFSLMECSEYQATLGKMALNLVVTDEQGRRISFLRALGRNAAKVLSMFILFIGYVMMVFTSRKQTLHDKLSQCLVLKKV